jgi:hypothetical protein
MAFDGFESRRSRHIYFELVFLAALCRRRPEGTTAVSIALKGETSNEVSQRRGRFAGRC